MKFCQIAIATSLVLLISRTAQATITVNGIGLEAIVGYDDSHSAATSETKSFGGTTIPTVPDPAILDASMIGGPGETYSKNSVNWSVDGAQTILSFDISHKTTGVPVISDNTFNSWAATEAVIQPLNFTADVDATYELSGFYNVTIVSTSYIGYQQFVILVDVTDVTGEKVLFFENSGVQETFIDESVSSALGDEVIQGSLTGNLIAGHTYDLIFSYNISQFFLPNDPWSAVGNLTLEIEAIDSIPEPTSLAIGSVLGLVILSRRRHAP